MKANSTSEIRGISRKSIPERIAVLEELLHIDAASTLESGVSEELADKMVENAIGTIGIPLGVATHFLINGRDRVVPMAIEEPSVIAAASNAAKMARAGSGFFAEADPPLMAAQIEILDPQPTAVSQIEAHREEILGLANQTQEELVRLGGGARDIEIRPEVGEARRLVVHLIVDCKDAMGANSVNTMAEAVSPRIASLTGGRAGLRILTNLADKRLARATCRIPFNAMRRGRFSGEAVSNGVVEAAAFAHADPYRAATHNKGIFNGIDAVLVATGNDWRAVEAGGHAFAARKGDYRPLSTWEVEEGDLKGAVVLPMALGTVGGASRAHPVARLCLDILEINTAAELAMIVTSVGLATNLAALSALACEGIQFGHMRLHARKQQAAQK